MKPGHYNKPKVRLTVAHESAEAQTDFCFGCDLARAAGLMQFAQTNDLLPNWNVAPADNLEDLGSLWDTPAELWNLAANMSAPIDGQPAPADAIPLGSVGSGTANFLDDLPAVVQPKRANSKEDRKLAVSREAQKRFRQRQSTFAAQKAVDI